MNSNEAAYLAAVIDGEGHLSITKKQLPQCRWPTFGARLGIANTNKAWLEGFQQEIGGWLRAVGRATGNRKQVYSLVLEGALVAKVLAQIQPFLRLKKQQGLTLLRYFDLAARRRDETQGWMASSPEIIEELNALYLEQKQLNWRGVSKVAARRQKPMGRLCGVDGCGLMHFGRGYCKNHYKKFIVRGGPKRHDKVCQQCETPFVSKRNDARFCSERCRLVSYRKTSPPPE